MAAPQAFIDAYRASVQTHHPPLLVLLLHYLNKINSSEVFLRLPSIVTGALFPWFVYRWLERVWNRHAGFVALVVLALAPNVISLGAQARGYSPALCGMAAALYFGERARQEKSLRLMVASNAALYVAILAEYGTAFVALAAGLYMLACFWRDRPPLRWMAVWAAGQLGGIALYLLVFVTHVRPMMHEDNATIGFLRGAILQPGENALSFVVLNTVKQSAYLFSSIPVGIAGMCLFAAGLYLLWRNARLQLILFVPPFLLAAATAVAAVYPYGRSRHTIFLAMFIAAGVGIAMEKLIRPRLPILLAALAVLVPLWHLAAVEDLGNIGKKRHSLARMKQAVEFLNQNVSPGSLILADLESSYMLNYYLGRKAYFPVVIGDIIQWQHRGVHVAAVWWDHRSGDEFLTVLSFVRNHHPLGAEPKLWIVDGGWDAGIDVALQQKCGSLPLAHHNRFDGTIIVFQLPESRRDSLTRDCRVLAGPL
jgi:hypothetical protein